MAECKRCGVPLVDYHKSKKYCGTLKDKNSCAYIVNKENVTNRVRSYKMKKVCVDCGVTFFTLVKDKERCGGLNKINSCHNKFLKEQRKPIYKGIVTGKHTPF